MSHNCIIIARNVINFSNSPTNIDSVFFAELVKDQWPERSEEKIINSLNTRMKEIRQNTAVEANKKE